MNPFYKNLSLWIVIILMMVMLYNIFNQQPLNEMKIGYSDFLTMVEKEMISSVEIQGQELYVKDVSGARYRIYASSSGREQ